jgi:lactate dehydrogenase-like 2-hydroxyacid dehydrogenase
MAQSPDILLLGPMMPDIMRRLDAVAKVHRLYEAADPQAMITATAPDIRAMVIIGGKSPVDAKFLDLFPKLEIIANYGVGYDTIDTSHAASRGIIVTNTPDVLTEEVADLTLGLLIATVRRLPQADRYLRDGKWLQRTFPLTGTLRGKRVGIAGLGRIGQAIATRVAGFGLDIAYFGRRQQADVPYAYYDNIVALAAAVDILIVVTPGGETTRNLINKQVMDALGPSGVLINVARGSVVDQMALIAALSEGRLGAAGLDVFANEPNVPDTLIAMDQVVLLPHIGSGSIHTREAMAALVADNLLSWFAGNGPLTPVPETPVLRMPKQ